MNVAAPAVVLIPFWLQFLLLYILAFRLILKIAIYQLYWTVLFRFQIEGLESLVKLLKVELRSKPLKSRENHTLFG